MILTGARIQEAIKTGEIVIQPFSADQLNPTSYNFRMGKMIRDIFPDANDAQGVEHCIPDNGFLLRPQHLYLAHSAEVVGSDTYAATLLGRSSVGRLGIFLNITADLGHVGAENQWTLELTVVQPVRVYANMLIGQLCFWELTQGSPPSLYAGRYRGDRGPIPSREASLPNGTLFP